MKPEYQPIRGEKADELLTKAMKATRASNRHVYNQAELWASLNYASVFLPEDLGTQVFYKAAVEWLNSHKQQYRNQ